MTKNFYVKNFLIFSEDKEEITLYSAPEALLSTHSPDLIHNNRQIFEQLENIETGHSRKLEVSGRIARKDLKIILENIEKSKEKHEPESSDYVFLEKTSQLDILEQLLTNLPDKTLTVFVDDVKAYIEGTKRNEDLILDALKTKTEQLQTKLKTIGEEKRDYQKKELDSIKKKRELEEKHISQLEEKREKLEVAFSKEDEELENVRQQKTIEKKLHKLRFKSEDINIKIKIFKAKITSLNDRIRLGQKKVIRPILFILTLGLIYWTSFSDCSYVKALYQGKVNRQQEKLLILQRKMLKLRNDLEELKQEEQEKQKERVKSNRSSEKTRENLEENIKESANQIKELKKEEEEKEKWVKKYEDEERTVHEHLKEEENTMKQYEEYSCKNIQKKLEELLSKEQETISLIKELKKDISEQKTKVKGDWIIKL